MASSSYPGFPEAILADWKAVCCSVAELQLFWRFHVRFCGHKQDVAMLEDILLTPYLVLRKALLFTIVMQVRSLLDPATSFRRDNVSLARFVGLFEQDYPALHAKLTTLRQDIVAHCRDIEKWGNRRAGHADLLTVLKRETLPDVSRQHFEKAQDMMRELLHRVHAHFHGPEAPMDMPELVDGAGSLLSYIRAGRQAEVTEIEALL
jgi:hypothetical protein